MPAEWRTKRLRTNVNRAQRAKTGGESVSEGLRNGYRFECLFAQRNACLEGESSKPTHACPLKGCQQKCQQKCQQTADLAKPWQHSPTTELKFWQNSLTRVGRVGLCNTYTTRT